MPASSRSTSLSMNGGISSRASGVAVSGASGRG
jgi:hypothetical protein